MSDWQTDAHYRKRLQGDVKQISAHWPAVEEILADPQGQRGIAMWAGTENFFGFRRSEVTALAALNHAGKSTLAPQALLRLLCAVPDTKAMVYSPEMPAPRLAMQIVRQAGAKGLGDEARTQKILQWLSYRLMHIDTPGYNSRELLDAIDYHAFELGVTWFVVDSLMTLTDIRGDDLVAQKAFMQRLMQRARQLPIHVLLVVHCRKPDKLANRGDFDRFEIRGAGEISDFADNVLLLKRYRVNDREHRQTLVRDKERFNPGRLIDELDLGFDQASAQFVPEHANPVAYIPDLEIVHGHPPDV